MLKENQSSNPSFRTLKQDEILSVAGGTDDNIIIVTVQRPDNSIYLEDLLAVGLNFSDLFVDIPDPFADGLGDGGQNENDNETDNEHCPSNSGTQESQEQQVDRAAEDAASDIVAALGELPGVVDITETREFGAIIFEDANGNISTLDQSNLNRPPALPVKQCTPQTISPKGF